MRMPETAYTLACRDREVHDDGMGSNYIFLRRLLKVSRDRADSGVPPDSRSIWRMRVLIVIAILLAIASTQLLR